MGYEHDCNLTVNLLGLELKAYRSLVQITYQVKDEWNITEKKRKEKKIVGRFFIDQTENIYLLPVCLSFIMFLEARLLLRLRPDPVT